MYVCQILREPPQPVQVTRADSTGTCRPQAAHLALQDYSTLSLQGATQTTQGDSPQLINQYNPVTDSLVDTLICKVKNVFICRALLLSPTFANLCSAFVLQKNQLKVGIVQSLLIGNSTEVYTPLTTFIFFT